jgi:hypothetical protein
MHDFFRRREGPSTGIDERRTEDQPGGKGRTGLGHKDELDGQYRRSTSLQMRLHSPSDTVNRGGDT